MTNPIPEGYKWDHFLDDRDHLWKKTKHGWIDMSNGKAGDTAYWGWLTWAETNVKIGKAARAFAIMRQDAGALLRIEHNYRRHVWGKKVIKSLRVPKP